MRRALAVIVVAGVVGGGLLAPEASGQVMVQVPVPSAHVLPRTRAERSGYLETSTFADVNAFIDSLRLAGLPFTMGLFGRSPERRWIPYIIATRLPVSTPEQARRSRRPVVYVQANIHAGEVEGKEALLALVRDLLAERKPNVLDSIVLIAVPIYNTDGNEKLAPQAVNRSEQNGPELVGQRPNGQGLDLNRDYVKVEAPETWSSLVAFARWDPDLFVDLHTTDGSFHGYALTYAPPLAPVGIAGAFVRDSLLPVLRERMRTRDGFETFDYGNFDIEDAGYRGGAPGAERAPGDTAVHAWETYDHRPRYGVNYVGIRGRAAILSEAFSHDPFERRVKSTYAFVHEILSLAAARPASFRRIARAQATGPKAGSMLAIRAHMTRTPYRAPVIVEDIERLADTTLVTQPGVPRGKRRTGQLRTLQLDVYDRFDPEYSVPVPAAYAIPADRKDVIRALRMHGVHVDRILAPARVSATAFVVDSVAHARRVFQGHNETTLHGRWLAPRTITLARGSYLVRTGQPLGALAVYLLEPESDDGLVTWNTLDAVLRGGAEFPIVRVTRAPAVSREAVP
ncbi:MAG TPA: M14 family metallopeptidase [Gemmatimonadaceae bacterium]|nr:M14 family metallopeptidase [Gemmatimonadaceae bacterium]